MALCTLASLTEKGLDIEDIRERFENWYYNDYMTPYGKVFDCGITIADAIENRKGCTDEYSNGNGSLMRILPIAYYLYAHKELNLYDVVKEVSNRVDYPIAVYNVSGEYSMVKSAGINGWIDENKVIMENMIAFKRAGAKIIITYHAIEVAKLINSIN